MSFIPHPHKALKTGIQGHWILAKFQRALVSSLHISVVPVLFQFLVFKECLFWQFTVTFKKLFKKCLSKKNVYPLFFVDFSSQSTCVVSLVTQVPTTDFQKGCVIHPKK